MSNNQTIYRFGRFEFDVRSGELRDGVQRRPLSKKPAQALSMLLDANGRVVGRNELASVLWPQSDNLDTGDRLNHVIKRLRDVLGDASDNPTYVETLTGRGYRFLAPVAQLGSDATLSIKQSEQFSKRQRFWISAAAAILVVVIGAQGIHGFYRQAYEPEKHTVTVRPIRTFSTDSDAEQWGKALEESLVSALAAGEGVNIRRVEGTKRPVSGDIVLEGFIVTTSAPHRFAARLVDSAQETLLWSQLIEQKTQSLDRYQARIVNELVPAVLAHMLPPEAERVSAVQNYEPERDQRYQAGLQLLDAGRTDEAVAEWQSLIAEEPTHALAHADLSRALLHRGWFTSARSEKVMPRARMAALKALELDGSLAQPYLVLANIKAFYDWDWSAADELYKKALVRNPNYAPTYVDYAGYLVLVGRESEAREMMRAADAVDPYSTSVQGLVGMLFHYLEEFDRAHVHFDNALTSREDHVFHAALKACTYIFQGRYDDAHQLIRRTQQLVPGDDTMKVVEAYMLIAMGESQAADVLFAQVDLEGLPTLSEMMSVSVFAAMGRMEEALTMLEKAYDERLVALPFSLVHPAYRAIRAEPRYQAVIKQVGLEVGLPQDTIALRPLPAHWQP